MTKNKSNTTLLVILLLVTMISSCASEGSSYVQQEFCQKYDLPSDFSEAIEYIDSELE